MGSFCKKFKTTCSRHAASCSGCKKCRTSKTTSCPKWCGKHPIKCYKIESCQGCPRCNWDDVQEHVEAVQADPALVKDILAKSSCPKWCVKKPRPKNLCLYPLCLDCPSCVIARRLANESVWDVELAVTSV